jgi:hypothetical protein
MAPRHIRRFAFVEQPETAGEEERGLKEFLHDSSLCGGATAAEVEFLRALRFKGRHPTPLYYYRELQNLRDPLHFRGPVLHVPAAPESADLPQNADRSKTQLAL